MNAEGHPAILYFHPWEIDPGQPRVADAPIKSKIRHYSGLSAMAGKLKKLLADFEWARADALLPAQQQRAQPWRAAARSEEHTAALQSLMRISYAVICLKKKKQRTTSNN